MLDKINLKKIMLKEEYKQEVPPLKQKMGELQQRFKQAKVPVIVLFEGWGASGKGSLMSNVILTMDPRGFHVESTTPPTLEERRHPYLWRFWKKLPARGTMGVFDRGWYQELAFPSHALHLEQKELRERLESVKIFERQLHDDGYLILKFFLHIGQREQKKRFDKLLSSKDTAWRVSLNDLEQNRRYDEYYQIIDGILEETNTDYAPWHVIGSEDKYSALAEIYHILVDGIGAAVEASREGKRSAPKKAVPIVVSDHFKLVEEPKLSEVNLTKALNEEEYRELLKKEQSTLKKLHNKIYRKKIPVVIAYEGWDAAGKGGNIRRVAEALDPRGYEVVPIAAPTADELAHQHLWRFWTKLPKDGHITIFDRTWYGRLMVERIECFASEEQWKRAYQEINEFEEELERWGAVIIKFWLHFSKEEQLKRFELRQNTPEKQWKITDEDWRNREKWDQYVTAVDEMIAYTSTDFAPWHIIESEDKKFARIKALRTIINSIEGKL